jgi:(E)-4-hydroxy-3-methyl-but-2-enyl pyrophosphate reductase
MKVIVAKTAGFCKGVKSALEVTLEAIQKREEGESLCTYGPLIHNHQVLKMLEDKGIRAENDIESCAGKKVVIRAHGIPPHERQALHKLGASLLDATCIRVAKVHGVIKLHARRGYHTVIVGDADHAEVIGLMGYTEGRGVVIDRPEQVDQLPGEWEKVLLVVQTTQNEEIFHSIEQKFLERYPNGVVKNTICGSTHERQAEVREIRSQVEAMIIVGGYHSGNTLRLAEVARESAIPCYHIETEADLNRQEMARYSVVGVSAGASTPNWIIRNVVRFLESIEPERPSTRFKLKRTLELLAYGNVYVAMAAALLPFTVQALTGFRGSLANNAMAAFYAFAIHSLNIYLDRTSIQLNDPGRAAFYQSWRFLFTGISILAVVGSLFIAFRIGILTFLAMGILVLLGILYAVPLMRPTWWQRLASLKIKDIPTSKTFSVPIAWAAVTVLVPYLSSAGLLREAAKLLYAFCIVFLLVLIRTVLLDLLAVHGDRLVGKETFVVLVGQKKTARFVNGAVLVLGICLIAGPLIGLATPFAYLMLPFVAVYALHLRMCFNSRLKEDPIFETMIESVIIAVGCAALVWNLIFSR